MSLQRHRPIMGLQIETEAEYTDRDFLVNPQKVLKTSFSETGNGLSYTAVYARLLVRRNELTEETTHSFFRTLDDCELSADVGLFSRSPEKIGDQNGADDYVCMASASSSVALDIHRYAIHNGWNFNNVNPGKFTLRSWFGRSPQFRSHICFAAGIAPPLWARIGWAIQTMLAPTDATGTVLTYFMVASAKGKSTICDLASRFWRWKTKGPDMKSALAKWLNNPDHPIVKYWVDG